MINHLDIAMSVEGCVYDDAKQQWVSLADQIDTKIAKKNVAEALRSMSRDECQLTRPTANALEVGACKKL